MIFVVEVIAASVPFVLESTHGNNLLDSIEHFNHSVTYQSDAFPEHGSIDEEVPNLNLPIGMQFL
jgi:hypothetical protein